MVFSIFKFYRRKEKKLKIMSEIVFGKKELILMKLRKENFKSRFKAEVTTVIYTMKKIFSI
jgi:hypothetical protein